MRPNIQTSSKALFVQIDKLGSRLARSCRNKKSRWQHPFVPTLQIQKLPNASSNAREEEACQAKGHYASTPRCRGNITATKQSMVKATYAACQPGQVDF